jgi:hypothetical protein
MGPIDGRAQPRVRAFDGEHARRIRNRRVNGVLRALTEMAGGGVIIAFLEMQLISAMSGKVERRADV